MNRSGIGIFVYPSGFRVGDRIEIVHGQRTYNSHIVLRVGQRGRVDEPFAEAPWPEHLVQVALDDGGCNALDADILRIIDVPESKDVSHQQEGTMKMQEFCYWLQGYFELLSDSDSASDDDLPVINNAQAKVIQQHLAMVFKHDIDPQYGDAQQQQELQNIHDGFPPQHIGDGGDVLYKC